LIRSYREWIKAECADDSQPFPLEGVRQIADQLRIGLAEMQDACGGRSVIGFQKAPPISSRAGVRRRKSFRFPKIGSEYFMSQHHCRRLHLAEILHRL
jgi:hypothetical protein